MPTTMQRNGYIARVEFDQELGQFHGRIINIKDMVTFYGRSVEELEQEFDRSLEVYLEVCREKGIEPGRPFSGRFNVRLSGFFQAAGAYLWERLRGRIEPPAIPRERYYVTHNQFGRWKREVREFYEDLQAKGYEFTLQVEERVAAFEAEGWKKLIYKDMEVWWKNERDRDCAYLVRKPNPT